MNQSVVFKLLGLLGVLGVITSLALVIQNKINVEVPETTTDQGEVCSKASSLDWWYSLESEVKYAQEKIKEEGNRRINDLECPKLTIWNVNDPERLACEKKKSEINTKMLEDIARAGSRLPYVSNSEMSEVENAKAVCLKLEENPVE